MQCPAPARSGQPQKFAAKPSIDIPKHRHEVLIAISGKTRWRRLTITNSTDYFMLPITIFGPVAIWCRSFDSEMCSKGDEP
jgi:hypothetical protein